MPNSNNIHDRLLIDACERKIPIYLRSHIKSECPMGNASITPYDNNRYYLCSFREFLYDLNGAVFPYIYKKEHVPTSKNSTQFILLGKDFRPNKGIFKNVVVDEKDWLYDGRLFRWGDKVYFSSVREHDSTQTQSIFKVHDKDFTIRLELIYDSVKDFGDNMEKNWMAVPDMPDKMVYGILKDCTRVIDISTGKMEDIPHDISDVPEQMRGNTPLLKIDEDTYITLTHQRLTIFDYVQYICVLDGSLKLKHISKRFRFDKNMSLEMSISLFKQIGTDNIGVTVCEMDAFQYVYLINKQKLIDFIYD